LQRVVVTGLGAVTPVGVGVRSYWDAICAGQSGVGPLTLVDPEPVPSKVAAECLDFDPTASLGPKEARRLDRSTQFALTAAREAWDDSGIEEGADRDEIGVVFATGIGGISSLLASDEVMRTKGPNRVSPFTVPQLMPNAAAGQIAMKLGLRGPNFTTTTACAASNHAIGLAFQAVRHGEATAMIAGGAEGAGAMILEEREHALARGATIHGEVVGFGQSADAFHVTAPSEDGSGAALAMRRALRSAGLAPEEVGYVNAHGTSTPAGDVSETRAIRLAFGDHADRLPVSSTKSMIGHLFGAAGAVEGIATVLAVRDGILPPTINQTDPDPACDLDYIPNEARKAEVDGAMSNGFGFGGHNAVLVFRRHQV
jgi:3-oxoacyl-[acyl-carrier-protein] synthase II